jgi:hypothetical protein
VLERSARWLAINHLKGGRQANEGTLAEKRVCLKKRECVCMPWQEKENEKKSREERGDKNDVISYGLCYFSFLIFSESFLYYFDELYL